MSISVKPGDHCAASQQKETHKEKDKNSILEYEHLKTFILVVDPPITVDIP